jgi:hypothetical protein
MQSGEQSKPKAFYIGLRYTEGVLYRPSLLASQQSRDAQQRSKNALLCFFATLPLLRMAVKQKLIASGEGLHACLACFFATLAEGGKTKAWRQARGERSKKKQALLRSPEARR